MAPGRDRLKAQVGTSRPYRRLRDVLLRAHRDNVSIIREDLARVHLRGEGIEIGPMTMPLRLPPEVRARYVDRRPRAELIATDGPELARGGLDPQAIPEIDVVDDAATLATIADASVDFVIASHVLEHLDDPVQGLETFVRVVRPGGIVFLVLPDARYSFDAGRARTTVEHVLRDHAEGPAVSRKRHYEEWARDIEGQPEDRVPERVAHFAREDARHHFHVWELADFLALLGALELPAELVHARAYAKREFAVILRRSG